MRHLFTSVMLCFSMFSFAQGTYTDSEDLQDAVNSATDGGVFIVPDGTYNDFESSFEIMATAENPIIVKAETIGGVTLTGESLFVLKKSAYITIEGFVFDARGEDTLIKLEGSNNIRITRNVFELDTEESIKWVFIGGFWSDNTFPFEYPSHHNRIDHNVFQNKKTPGHYITVDGSFDNSGSDEIYYQSTYDQIDHNHFIFNGPRATNEQESIRIGWSEMSLSSGFTTVEHNLFTRCDGDPEIISVKSSDNIVRHNTFRGCYGTLSLRHGNRNWIEGNYFFGEDREIGMSDFGSTLYTGGIRIYGTDHVIVNNYMEGLTGTIWDAPIALTLGDAVDGESSNLSKHFRAERVTIAYNTLVNNTNGIEIGFDNNNNYNKDLEDIIIANNLITGSENSLVRIIESGNDQGDNITWRSNILYPTEVATMLSGASSTSFDDTEAVDLDPVLTYDEIHDIWRATESTPLMMNTITEVEVTEDIDGQPRPELSNPGADQYSTEEVIVFPLTWEDVGTGAADTPPVSSVKDLAINVDIEIYPNPTSQLITINSSEPIYRLEIRDMNGQLVTAYPQSIQGQEEVSVSVAHLSTGTYLLTSRYRNGTYLSEQVQVIR